MSGKERGNGKKEPMGTTIIDAGITIGDNVLYISQRYIIKERPIADQNIALLDILFGFHEYETKREEQEK